jgi:CRISPR/Cas system endoribonuclease Cas6 (RAMP superfamily)
MVKRIRPQIKKRYIGGKKPKGRPIIKIIISVFRPTYLFIHNCYILAWAHQIDLAKDLSLPAG